MTEYFNVMKGTMSFGFIRYPDNRRQSNTINIYDDPNGFNTETVLALIEASDPRNLSKTYDSLEEMYRDMGLDV